MKHEPLRITIFTTIVILVVAIALGVFLIVDKNSSEPLMVETSPEYVETLEKGAIHNYIIVSIDGKQSFSDTEGELVEGKLYDFLSIADYGLYYFKIDNRQGFLDENLNEIFSTEEIIATNVSEYFVVYSSGNKKGYINIVNGDKIKAVYDNASDFSEGLAAVQIGEKTGFIDTAGQLVIPCEYSNNAFYQFKSGKCNVVTGSVEDNSFTSFYINKKGEKLFNAEFEYCMPFSEGRAFVSKARKWYIIDEEGKTVGEETFDPSTSSTPVVFNQERAMAFKDGKYGVVNLNGEFVVSPKYEYISGFSDEGAVFKQNGIYGYMNKNGSIIISAKYESLTGFKNGLAVFSVDNKYGVIDKAATVVVAAEYEDISIMDNGLIKISADNKFYYVNKYGQTVYENKTE